jgi:CBS domain-containing protein
MTTATKPLLHLTATDLMTETLVFIPRHMSLRAAARLLAMHQISGAPVVDDDGSCVGVLSAMDFVHLVERGETGSYRRCSASSDYYPPWQIANSNQLPEETVDHYMTADPVAVSPGATISELARIMIDAHIHRVLVVNEFGHPRGIISSTDILAALASASPARCHEFEKGADL